ncbi:MAG: nucleotide-binding protein [Rhodothalassiaceae bacterium]|nr:MAG: nucleotide-binding protein [Rhodothalassiaceae bacterium]
MTETARGPTDAPGARLRVVLVTGMSGAGKTSALHALEDMGYEAVDNLPLSLVRRLLAESHTGPGERPLALGIDLRTRGFDAGELAALLDDLRARPDVAAELLFFDASDDVLMRRFSETRRPHPAADDRPLRDAILIERHALAPVRALADFIYDTSESSIHDLRRRLKSRFAPVGDDSLLVTIISFGYARGVPREADLVFDARFLRNPHYDPALRPLTGRDRAVARHIAADPRLAGFWRRLTGLVSFLLPAYREEGKRYLTIAFGCTGGRHRSVYLAERLRRSLARRGIRASIIHRDCPEAQDRAQVTDSRS